LFPVNASEVAASVDRGWSLKQRIEADREELKKIETTLIELGPGEYAGDSGRRAQVIQPSPAIKPKTEAVETARELIGDEPTFKKLFEKIVTWKPAKSFREVAAAILPKNKLTKVIETCEVDCAAYVLFK